MKKIKTKLLLAFILISLVPLIVLGGYGLINVSKSLGAASTSKLNDKVGLISSEVETFLSNVKSDLFYLRDSVSLRLLIESMETTKGNAEQIAKARKHLAEDFKEFSRHKKIYHQVRFLTADGMEYVRVNHQGSSTVIVPDNLLQNKKKRYYFADTARLDKGSMMISPLDLNRERGKVEKPLRPVIRYGTPVYDQNNKLQGIVLFNVYADNFLQFIYNENDGKVESFFIDKDGYYFSNPDTTKEWGKKSDLGNGFSFKQDYPNIANKIMSTATISSALSDQHIFASAPVFLDQEQTNLLGYVVDIVPTKIVFSSVNTFRNIFLIISLSVFLVTMFFAVFLSKTITDPLVYLTKITKDMSRGKIYSKVVVSTKDEIKTLAVSIERLRKSVVILMKMKNEKEKEKKKKKREKK